MEPATIVVIELPLAPLNQGGGGGDCGRSGERGGGDGASRWGAPGGDGINGGSAGGAGGGYIGADAITAGVSWQAEGLNPSGIQSRCGRLSQLAYMSGRYNSNMPLWWCVVRAGGVREAWRFSMQWLCPVPCTPCIMGIVIRQSSQDAGVQNMQNISMHATNVSKQIPTMRDSIRQLTVAIALTALTPEEIQVPTTGVSAYGRYPYMIKMQMECVFTTGRGVWAGRVQLPVCPRVR